jgi:transglutaminase superfamily protein
MKLAREALGDEKDAWKAAQKLERFTSTYISNKNMDNLFETATGVMKSRAGDCTEHGVFLAGLCRAAGIPARVAVGFLYFQGIWGGHMWAEVSLGGKWYAIDGVLGQGSVDAAHLRLAANSLKSMQIEQAFQNVALGMTMKIDIVSFRHGKREVKVGSDFESFVVDGQKFTSTLYDFSITAPAGFTVKPNREISLHDLLVVEFARDGGGAKVEVSDVTAAFSLDEAKESVASEGVSRMKTEDRKVDGRPARIFRGKKGDHDVLVATVLDGQTLIMVTLPRLSDGDDDAFDAILGSLKFSQPAPAGSASGSGS